jgi:hypothetical protein
MFFTPDFQYGESSENGYILASSEKNSIEYLMKGLCDYMNI